MRSKVSSAVVRDATLSLEAKRSPWVLGYATEATAAWNAWMVGGAIAVAAGVALFTFGEWQEWLNVAFGLWAILAPWLLGFSGLDLATIAHVVAGLVVCPFSGNSQTKRMVVINDCAF